MITFFIVLFFMLAKLDAQGAVARQNGVVENRSSSSLYQPEAASLLKSGCPALLKKERAVFV
ncbi:hypothetical protein [Phaeodactylibacter luteus]|uniref:Uncharacterized protein n=1 Tax=Phaeodactylibacter luteus TaxID=1564516 RepID=A0A5C6S2V4_9BACT|nr:hypothetical protein [Phaeodactylibacter luteus]TXB68959.1 hypothetical protein FRY97_02515 [Phaeodactylibacter luteus]